MARNRPLTLQERAKISASMKHTIGSPEWYLAYEAFVNSGGQVFRRKKQIKKVEINAAQFASYHAKGLKGLPVWKALYQNYIERTFLIEEAKKQLAMVELK